MKTQLNLPVSAHVDCIIDTKNIVISRIDTNEPNLLTDIVKLINNTAKVHYLLATGDDTPICTILAEKENAQEITDLVKVAYQAEFGVDLIFISMDCNSIDKSYTIHFKDEENYKFKVYVTPITVYSQD